MPRLRRGGHGALTPGLPSSLQSLRSRRFAPYPPQSRPGGPMTELLTTLDGTQSALAERYAGALMNTFGAPKRVLVRGEGAYLWDADGNKYLDLLGGLAVNCLGHAQPFVVSAVTSQLATLGHVSNFFASAPQIALAEKLLGLFDVPGKVFFTN